jgi:hypothetical protein
VIGQRFIERREARQKPRPALWLAIAVGWAVIGVLGLVVLVVPPGPSGHRNVVLAVILIVGAAANVPIALWRRSRDRKRQGTWVKPA